jgi:hypothetical protein
MKRVNFWVKRGVGTAQLWQIFSSFSNPEISESILSRGKNTLSKPKTTPNLTLQKEIIQFLESIRILTSFFSKRAFKQFQWRQWRHLKPGITEITSVSQGRLRSQNL